VAWLLNKITHLKLHPLCVARQKLPYAPTPFFRENVDAAGCLLLALSFRRAASNARRDNNMLQSLTVS
jgi:hypothetical protein